MQVPVISRSGQKKPYGSIPRIDRSHPLAQGLVSYVYDCGGLFYDLVSGQTTTVNNGGTFFGTNSSSKYGSGFKFPLGAAAYHQCPAFNFPANSRIGTLGGTASRTSFAVGFNPSNIPAQTVSIIAGYANPSNSTGYAVLAANASSNGDLQLILGSGAVGFGTNIAPAGYALNAYHTASLSVTTSTVFNAYFDGVLAASPTGTLTHAETDVRASLNNAGGVGGDGFAGFIYWMAAWSGRALTDKEHSYLNADPYCFLIYPEDELFTQLTLGATGTTFTQTVNVGCATSTSASTSYLPLLTIFDDVIFDNTFFDTASGANAAVFFDSVVFDAVIFDTVIGGGGSTVFNQAANISSTTVVAAKRAIGKGLAAALTAAETAIKSVGKRLAIASTAAEAALLSIGKKSSIASTTATSLSSGLAYLRVLAVACVSAVGSVRYVGKLSAVASTSLHTSIRRVSLGISSLAVSTSAISVRRAFLRVVTVGCLSAVALARQADKLVSVSSTGLVSIVRRASRSLTATGSSATAVIKGVGRIVAVATASAVITAAQRLSTVIQQSISAAAGSSIDVSRQARKTMQAATASATATIKHALLGAFVSCTGVVTSWKSVAHSVASNVSIIATLLRSVLKRISSVASSVVDIAVLRLTNVIQQAISVAASSSVNLSRSIAKFSALGSAITVAALRSVSRRCTIICNGAASSSKIVANHISVAVISAMSILANIAARVFQAVIVAASSTSSTLRRSTQKIVYSTSSTMVSALRHISLTIKLTASPLAAVGRMFFVTMYAAVVSSAAVAAGFFAQVVTAVLLNRHGILQGYVPIRNGSPQPFIPSMSRDYVDYPAFTSERMGVSGVLETVVYAPKEQEKKFTNSVSPGFVDTPDEQYEELNRNGSVKSG